MARDVRSIDERSYRLTFHEILQPRLEAFTKLNVFKEIEEKASLELRGPEERGFHGRTTTLCVPSSGAVSGKVELSFRLGHDGPSETAS
ncbi:MAG: hypothetical protein A2V70_16625 [Planctomycetes bacterium RBG_13_63_9]|nr:MAG: hypothetical protein A2V70_16625 [Planctomycetes bacterium RBG_13_63_9]